MSDQDVAVVTGWGAVSALGRGAAELWRALELGRDGIAAIRRFSTDAYGVKIAALVPSHNDAASGRVPVSDLLVDFALGAAKEAWADARLDEAAVARDRVAFVMGTSPVSDPVRVFELTERIADELDVRGPRVTVSTACTSSTNAVGLALDLLRGGAVDVAIAGGVDVVMPLMFAGFHALGVLSAEKCTPFGPTYGTTLGEGAGFFVLESRTAARTRGVKVRAALSGYGLSGDAFHETGPDPTGSGVARAIRAALGHSGLRPEQIGYVNAHGTGTAANDPAEWRALQAVFGARASELPTSSTKSVLGHAQAAAGVLETLATLLGMERQMFPQTLRVSTGRANCPPDAVAQPTPRPGAFRHALCLSSAFGGANASIVVTAPDDGHERAVPRTREIFVAGVGAALPDARDGDALVATLFPGEHAERGDGAKQISRRHGPTMDLGALDPSSRHLTAAATVALEDAGVGRVRGESRNTTGLVCGINLVSAESLRDLQRSIDKRGLPLLSAAAFSRMVLNAPAGSCSKALSLRGPLSTLSIGRGSGLMAILYAAGLLAERHDVTSMLAGGVDELDGPPSDDLTTPREGAACVVLSPAPAEPPRERSVRLAGWAVAGPDDVDGAVARALASASVPRAAIDEVFGADETRREDSMSSALDFVTATLWLRSGRARTALVIAAGGRSASCAAVLEARSG